MCPSKCLGAQSGCHYINTSFIEVKPRHTKKKKRKKKKASFDVEHFFFSFSFPQRGFKSSLKSPEAMSNYRWHTVPHETQLCASDSAKKHWEVWGFEERARRREKERARGRKRASRKVESSRRLFKFRECFRLSWKVLQLGPRTITWEAETSVRHVLEISVWLSWAVFKPLGLEHVYKYLRPCHSIHRYRCTMENKPLVFVWEPSTTVRKSPIAYCRLHTTEIVPTEIV